MRKCSKENKTFAPLVIMHTV